MTRSVPPKCCRNGPEKVPLALRTLHGRRHARPRSILVLPLLLRKSHQTRQPVPVHMTVENL